LRISAASKLLLAGLALGLLAGCARRGDIASSGEGIIQIRDACPIVAVAAHTGDVTLFDPADARTVAAIDVSAAISNMHSSCVTRGDQLVSQATFLVVGLRRAPRRRNRAG
jgi:type IV pilus biogenesis protein CpaD/CtpE